VWRRCETRARAFPTYGGVEGARNNWLAVYPTILMYMYLYVFEYACLRLLLECSVLYACTSRIIVEICCIFILLFGVGESTQYIHITYITECMHTTYYLNIIYIYVYIYVYICLSVHRSSLYLQSAQSFTTARHESDVVYSSRSGLVVVPSMQ
jgi:hypothetical protein